MYVQVIPLFTKSDREAFRFVTGALEEIDRTTGSKLQFVLPEVGRTGDVDGIEELFPSEGPNERYPGLRRSDLPCFWVEDEKEHVIVLIPNGATSINRRIRAMADAAEAGQGARGIKRWVEKTLAADSRGRSGILGVARNCRRWGDE